MRADRALSALTGVCVVLLALLAFNSPRASGQGFSGLGSDSDEYAKVVRGRPLAFPADHGAHSDYRIEWWYLTANLKDAQGNRYGVQWTLFRQATTSSDRGEGWDNRQLWMAHAAVTSADTHRFAERFARGGVGQAGVAIAPFSAWIDNWQMAATDQSADESLSSLSVTASAADFSYDLALKGGRPVVLQGDAGYSRKSERDQASYYYSQPYLAVTGTVTLDGKPVDVTGDAWIDHEWSSQPLASDQTGWDWFSLHLDTGEKLMLFRLRHADGKFFFAGNWIGLDGRSEQLANDAITMTPTRTTRVANRDIPTEWTIAIPSRRLTLSSVPLNPQSWMNARVKYWEGPVTVRGSHTGVGYLEMTGY
jgi:predicted secreted hydrolase